MIYIGDTSLAELPTEWINSHTMLHCQVIVSRMPTMQNCQYCEVVKHLITYMLKQELKCFSTRLRSAVRPHAAIFSGRHSIRSALRSSPTACCMFAHGHGFRLPLSVAALHR